MNLPWVEKYRPTDLDTIVLSNENKNIIQSYIDTITNNHSEKNKNIHLIFYGPPGTGKTTTAINIYKEIILRQIELQKENEKKKNETFIDSKHLHILKQTSYENILKQQTLHLNASDDRGIDVLRNVIYEFILNTNSIDIFVSKFVILDEIDYMTIKSQTILKNIIQNNRNVNFIFICNYIGKLHNFIINNCIDLKFNNLNRKYIQNTLKQICKNENINIRLDQIDTIISEFNSDVRSMINYLQQYKNTYYGSIMTYNSTNFLKILQKNEHIDEVYIETIVQSFLKKMDFKDMLKHIHKSIIDYNKELYEKHIKIETIYSNFNLIQCIQLHKELLFNKNIDNLKEYYIFKLSGFFSKS